LPDLRVQYRLLFYINEMLAVGWAREDEIVVETTNALEEEGRNFMKMKVVLATARAKAINWTEVLLIPNAI
jgi:hypothetical protein